MRLLGIVVAIVLSTGVAVADDKFKPYAGKVVISPDTPPTIFEELPTFLKHNFQSDNQYDVLKGPPWQINMVAVLSKDPGKKSVQLVFADKGDKKLTTMHAVDLTSKRKVVLAKVEATVAANFEHKTYIVRVMLGKQVLAKCEVTLKD